MLSEETKASLILSLLESNLKQDSKSFYSTGKVYVVRTVTMIYLGTLKKENSDSLILENAAWIPDTSRWSEFLDGKKPNEMEPYHNDVMVYKGGILDVTEMTKSMKIELI